MRAILTALVLIVSSHAYAQHNHSEGHPDYLTWESKKTSNCCSEQDCGDLNEDEIRETQTGTQVKIGANWCPHGGAITQGTSNIASSRGAERGIAGPSSSVEKNTSSPIAVA